MNSIKTYLRLMIVVGYTVLISCITDDNEQEQNSIIGTWKITALTSNGKQELNDELNYLDLCYWFEIFTATSITDINISGNDCAIETNDEVRTYIKEGTTLETTNKHGDINTYTILSLTSTTLKIQDTYSENGKTTVDIYTYIKQ